VRSASILGLAVLAILDSGSAAAAGSLEKSLMKLSPEERAHQACVIKGLEIVRRDKKLAKADRIMPDIFQRAQFDGSVVSAKGAAVHAGKQWFALSFDCKVSPDQLKAVNFAFQLGDEIPSERWEEVGLWR
jgi:hypothetical protein